MTFIDNCGAPTESPYLYPAELNASVFSGGVSNLEYIFPFGLTEPMSLDFQDTVPTPLFPVGIS